MSETIDLISGKIIEPEDQKKVINDAIQIAGQALGFSYIVCGLQTHIEGTMIIGGKTFKLTFYEQRPEAGINEPEV
jgi:hypothetical protein